MCGCGFGWLEGIVGLIPSLGCIVPWLVAIWVAITNWPWHF
jgi:hypothetical protein